VSKQSGIKHKKDREFTSLQIRLRFLTSGIQSLTPLVPWIRYCFLYANNPCWCRTLRRLW